MPNLQTTIVYGVSGSHQHATCSSFRPAGHHWQNCDTKDSRIVMLRMVKLYLSTWFSLKMTHLHVPSKCTKHFPHHPLAPHPKAPGREIYKDKHWGGFPNAVLKRDWKMKQHYHTRSNHILRKADSNIQIIQCNQCSCRKSGHLVNRLKQNSRRQLNSENTKFQPSGPWDDVKLIISAYH